MKKISSKQIFTYVALLCMVALVAVYMLVYKKNMDTANTLKMDNEALEARVQELKVYHDNEPVYLAEMEPMKEEIKKILEPYPVEIREEDLIMQAVYTAMQTPITYSGLNMSNASVMKTIDANVVAAAGMEEYQNAISFIQRKVTYPNTVEYESLKVAVQSLFDSEYPIGIVSLVYAGGETEDGETPKLNGTLDLVFYSVSGTGKEYEAPSILPYVSGTENIFGVAEDK